MLQFHKEQNSTTNLGQNWRLVADSFLYNSVDDTRVFGGAVCVHPADKEVSKPADEHVSK